MKPIPLPPPPQSKFVAKPLLSCVANFYRSYLTSPKFLSHITESVNMSVLTIVNAAKVIRALNLRSPIMQIDPRSAALSAADSSAPYWFPSTLLIPTTADRCRRCSRRCPIRPERYGFFSSRWAVVRPTVRQMSAPSLPRQRRFVFLQCVIVTILLQS